MDSTTTIQHLPVDALRASPYNPRRTFTDIADLAASIKAEGGVLQPLLVRPVRPNPLRDDIISHYEIVFGHRRHRATQEAGLATVPCMVKELSDAAARSAQIAENLQRKDVHPIEEAEGLQAMMDLDLHDAPSLAEMLGKSVSYVYGRLKLLQACPQVRQACLDGEVTSEVALLLARLRTERLQTRALQSLKSHNIEIRDGGKPSYREIKRHLAEKYSLPLDSAVFPITDATLLAGASSCTDCHKRTGNAPEFADIATIKRSRPGDMEWWNGERILHAGPDVCTDPDCWADKHKAHLARQAQALAAKGKKVVNGAAARAALDPLGKPKGAYLDAKEAQTLLRRGKVKADVDTVTIIDQRSGKAVQAVKRADLVAAGLGGLDPKAPSGKTQAASREDEDLRREQARAETAARQALLAAVHEATATAPRTLLDLRLIARYVVENLGWDSMELLCTMWGAAHKGDLKARMADMPADQLGRLMLDAVLAEDVRVYHFDPAEPPEDLHAVAKSYGLSVKEIRARATGAAQDTHTADLDLQGDGDQPKQETVVDAAWEFPASAAA